MRAKEKKEKKRSPSHGWYLSPLENHLCVPYDHLPPCLARRQMGYLAAASLVCLEAEPSSSHHGVNAGTGRVLSPCYDTAMTAAYKSFPSQSCASVFSTASTWTIQILQLQPPSSRALALRLPSEADETPDGGEFFRSSGVHLVKSPWKKKKKKRVLERVARSCRVVGGKVSSALQFLLLYFISTEGGDIRQVSKNKQVGTVLERK